MINFKRYLRMINLFEGEAWPEHMTFQEYMSKQRDYIKDMAAKLGKTVKELMDDEETWEQLTANFRAMMLADGKKKSKPVE